MARFPIRFVQLFPLVLCCCWSSFTYGQQWQWATQNQSNTHPDTLFLVQAEDESLLAISLFGGGGSVQMIHILPDGTIDSVQIIGSNLSLRAILPTQDGSNELFLWGFYVNNASLGATTFPFTGGVIIPFFARIDLQANVKWLKTVNSPNIAFTASGVDDENSLYFIGAHVGPNPLIYAGDTLFPTPTLGGIFSFYLAKMDSSGNEVWIRGMNSADYAFNTSLAVDGSGQVFMGGTMRGSTSFDSLSMNMLGGTEERYFLVSYDKDGQGLWGVESQSTNPNISIEPLHMAVDPVNQSVYMAGRFSQGDLLLGNEILSPQGEDHFLVSYFPDGTFQRIEHITGIGDINPQDLDVGPEGDVFLSGVYSTEILIDSVQLFAPASGDRLFVAKWKDDGEVRWITSAAGPSPQNLHDFLIASDGELFATGELLADTLIFGSDTLAKPGSFYVAQLGGSSTLVQGRIWAETDLDCVYDAYAFTLPQLIVKADPGPYYAASRADGSYRLNLDSGTYTIQQVLPGILDQISSPICPPQGTAHTLSIDPTSPDTSGFDFVNEFLPCYLLTARVANSRRRICSANLTLVQYCNLGADSAHNVQVHLQYSPEVSVQAASLPFTQPSPQYYQFDIGTLAPFSCQSITLTDFVDCNALSQIGENSCIEVWITPESTCTTPDSSWSLASLTLEGSCTGADTAEFWVKNEGQGAMNDSVAYRLFLNDTLIHQANLWLDIADSIRIRIPTGGKTAHMRVDQVPHHPRQDWIAWTVDACGRTAGFPFFPQFGNSFPQSDPGDLTFMRLCPPLSASYDPNDKQATPKGITEEKLIPPDSYLNYRIRFQNTGNDTAFKVVLIDTLPEWVDLSTLRMEGASHPYTYSLRGLGRPVMEIAFDPIILPDSGTNEPESNGFASFSFRIAAHTPLETPLENFADIYFDFNPPIRTDTVHHLVSNRMPVSLDPGIIEEVCFFRLPIVALLGSDSLFCDLEGERYAWYKDGIPLPDSTKTISISGSGFYSVQVVKGRCISDLSAAIEVVSTAIGTELRPEEITISPNPAKGVVRLTVNPPPPPESQICILDVYGRVVWKKQWAHLAGQEEKLLEVHALTSGMYYLSLQQGITTKILLK